MKLTNTTNWQGIQAEVLARIRKGKWKPGALIPGESELSVEFGCARATVNRALQGLAELGYLDRKRRAGTRVSLNPARKVTLEIPVLRLEIEGKGLVYRYELLDQVRCKADSKLMHLMRVPATARLLHLKSLHFAGCQPYVFEERWIHLNIIPQAAKVDFEKQSANEWLITNVPFEAGDITLSAIAATVQQAKRLECQSRDGLFMVERSTWTQRGVITYVRQFFAPGYRMHAQL